MSRPTTRPTLKTVAARLGLSISTVSRALKDSADIGRETIAEVKRVAADMGYVPDARGITLRTGKTFVIYYLKAIPTQQDVPDVAVAAHIDGVSHCLHDTGYQLQLSAWNQADTLIDQLSRIVDGRLADGIMLDSIMPFDLRVRYLLERDFPFVTFGRTELLTEHAYVDADNQQAAFDATQHLTGKGHRRIALMGMAPDFTYALQRRRGYLAALQAAGLPHDPLLMPAIGSNAEPNRAAIADLLALADPPTGFVCANESTTLGVMAGLRDAGRVIGQDCDVVSRDNSAFSSYLNPPLSTCYLGYQTIAEHLTRTLLRRIEGAPVAELQTVLPCVLVAR